ncbi:hypothetical protein KUTeg_011553 [Tegillarca granosa]|uniref:Amino acid transporter n=1 Tax=Tegillarca granosa TaxID=220873 RepID=A0ABQ9F2B3_TEGGR|nr:hypothetical protein KUTeg_011553 [Tegillarca granosa]
MEEADLSKDENKTLLQKFSVKRIGGILCDNLLLILTLCGILVGFCIGFGIRELHPTEDALTWIGMPGDIFLRVLKLMILPLIVCSVISGTASLDPKSNGKISGVAFVYIVLTNILGCVLGGALSLAIKPGIGGQSIAVQNVTNTIQTQDIFVDLLRNIFPDNIVEASFAQAQTKYTSTNIIKTKNGTNGTIYEKLELLQKQRGKVDGTNVLGLVMACTVIGIAAGQMKSKAKPFLEFFSISSEVMLIVLRWFMWLTPIGVTSLVIVSISDVDDIGDVFEKLGLFVATVTIGIILLHVVFLPLILFLTTRRNPYAYIVSIGKAWMIGFAATSTFLTAVAVMALPSVPSSSIVTLVMILTSLNIPSHDIALLFAVEWFLDRIRTAANVLSHTTCAAVTYQFCKSSLTKIPAEALDEIELTVEKQE